MKRNTRELHFVQIIIKKLMGAKDFDEIFINSSFFGDESLFIVILARCCSRWSGERWSRTWTMQARICLQARVSPPSSLAWQPASGRSFWRGQCPIRRPRLAITFFIPSSSKYPRIWTSSFQLPAARSRQIASFSAFLKHETFFRISTILLEHVSELLNYSAKRRTCPTPTCLRRFAKLRKFS